MYKLITTFFSLFTIAVIVALSFLGPFTAKVHAINDYDYYDEYVTDYEDVHGTLHEVHYRYGCYNDGQCFYIGQYETTFDDSPMPFPCTWYWNNYHVQWECWKDPDSPYN
jgi:hypothetical protein